MALTLGGRPSAQAATINVPADQPTIQDGINAAASGDTVLVAPGTYKELITLSGTNLIVASSGGPSVTTINGNGSGPVVSLSGTATLSGFTITGGNASYEGGGIVVSSGSPTIFGNVITGNVACGDGGGISVQFSSPTIQSNTISNNQQSNDCSGGTGGGGIEVGGAGDAIIIGNTISNNTWSSGDGGGISLFASGSGLIMNNLITGNTATGVFDENGTPDAMGGGIATVNDSDPDIYQNIIINNHADLGAGVAFLVPSESMGPTLSNNTFFGNDATQIGSAIYASGYDGPVEVINNLLIAPSGETPVYCDSSFQPFPPVFENNDATGTAPVLDECDASPGQFGNVSADPMFVNSGAGDFHLTSGSPAIDVGLNAAAGFSITDYYGNARIVAGKAGDSAIVDVGAAEYQPPSPFVTPTPTATPTPAPNQIDVPADYPTIQGAIDAATGGETIMVAPGRYFEALNFNGKAITVTSSAGAASTTIDAHGLGTAITFSSGETNASVLLGFTITGGLNTEFEAGGIMIAGASPTISSNVINDNYSCGGGSGIYSSDGSPIIQSNSITNNQQFANSYGSCSGGAGGGIYITGPGSAQIIGNTISGNSWTSGNGGGIELDFAGTPLLMNNTIVNNLATGVFGETPEAAGGGIAVENSTNAALIQNLIIDNNADWGAGVFISGDSTALMVNNTIAGNPSTQNLGSALYAAGPSSSTQLYNNLFIGRDNQDALYCAAGTPTLITNDLFSSGAEAITGSCASLAGTSGNISADPLFTSVSTMNYELLDGSPAIDAGTNSAPDLPATDFYGNPRIVAGYVGDSPIVDMGIAEAPAGEIKPSPTITPTATVTSTPTPTATATATPTATSTPVPAKLEIKPRTVKFANTAVGKSSKSEKVVLSNPRSRDQNSPILLENASIAGPYAIDQAQSTCQVGSSIEPQTHCDFVLTFLPTEQAEQNGTLTIDDNSEPGSQSVIALKGKGTKPK